MKKKIFNITINSGFYSVKPISLELSKKGIITVKVKGLSNDRVDELIFIHDKKKVILEGTLFEERGAYKAIEEFMEKTFLQEYFTINLVSKENNKYEFKYKRMDKELIEIIKSLKRVETDSDTSLRYLQLEKFEDNKIYFKYLGHEVGGSYVHDYEVAPSYIKAIEFETNYKTKWINRTSGGIGSDYYHFELDTQNIIDKKKYKVIGKLFYLRSRASFVEEGGETFSYLYNITRDIKKKRVIPGVEIINDEIFFDETPIAKVVEYKDEVRVHIKGNNTDWNRTDFSATFDLYISEIEFKKLFFNKAKEIVNNVFQEYNFEYKAEKVFLLHVQYMRNRLSIKLDNEFIYSMSSRTLYFDNKEIQDIKNNMAGETTSKFMNFIHYNEKIDPEYDEKVSLWERGRDSSIQYIRKEHETNYILDEIYKNCVDLANKIKYNNFKEVKNILKTFITPLNKDNPELETGINRILFIQFSKTKEMDTILFNWIYEELIDGFRPNIMIDKGSEPLLNFLYEKGIEL